MRRSVEFAGAGGPISGRDFKGLGQGSILFIKGVAVKTSIAVEIT
jgi:hypothetical protein